MAERAALHRDLKILATFIRLYCLHRHPDEVRHLVHLPARGPEEARQLRAVLGGPLVLCPACARLVAHAFYKRSHCPLDPKPACKHCPAHCYHPDYRAQIREVMKFSGRYVVMHGRVDLLFHLLF